MRIYIGDKCYDGNDKPFIIYFEEGDKALITNMAPDNNLLAYGNFNTPDEIENVKETLNILKLKLEEEKNNE